MQSTRPINIHRSCSILPLNIEIMFMWTRFTELVPAYGAARRGRKPKASPYEQFRLVVLDLYTSWLEGPENFIGIDFKNSKFPKADSRYNRNAYTRSVKPIVKAMAELGWIEMLEGEFWKAGDKSNRITRIRALDGLMCWIRPNKKHLPHLLACPNRECVVLRKTPRTPKSPFEKKQSGDVLNTEYADNEISIRSRNILTAYNRLITNTHVDVASLEATTVAVQKMEDGELKEKLIQINQANKFSRRIFSRCSFEKNGRIYGGWWQNIPSNLRRSIRINGKSTIEIDFNALHPNLIYSHELLMFHRVGNDHYDLGLIVDSTYSAEMQRAWLKQLVVIAFNAKSRKTAVSVFYSECDPESTAATLPRSYLHKLLDLFIEKHPDLETYLCHDKGIDLMRLDSEIAMYVIERLTWQGIPVLCVHDSFIVPRENYRDLWALMMLGSFEISGTPLSYKHTYYDQIPTGIGLSAEATLIESLPEEKPCEAYWKRYASWLESIG